LTDVLDNEGSVSWRLPQSKSRARDPDGWCPAFHRQLQRLAASWQQTTIHRHWTWGLRKRVCNVTVLNLRMYTMFLAVSATVLGITEVEHSGSLYFLAETVAEPFGRDQTLIW